VAAVFDAKRAFRAFGVTAAGELVALVVPSGMAAHHCRVRQNSAPCTSSPPVCASQCTPPAHLDCAP
jgi:hypothetical protein